MYKSFANMKIQIDKIGASASKFVLGKEQNKENKGLK